MGYWKNKEIEEEAAMGYMIPDRGEKYVCVKHYEDPFLRKRLAEYAHNGKCSYCGCRGRVIDLADLVNVLGKHIVEFYNNIEYECLPAAHDWADYDEKGHLVMPPGIGEAGYYAYPTSARFAEDTAELFESLGVYTDIEALDQDVLDCFADQQWIKKDVFGDDENEVMSYAWNRFAEVIKKDFKDSSFSNDMPSTYEDYLDYRAKTILNDIENLIYQERLFYNLKPTEQLFRSQNIESLEVNCDFARMTSAPSKYASNNRMSKKGESMFYGSFDIESTLLECQKKEENGVFAIGTFRAKRNLVLIDLTNGPDCSFWKDTWQECLFLQDFKRTISKPISSTDKEIEYKPTQYVTNYLREHIRYRNRPIDGIVYPSSKTRCANVVLFYDNETSAEVLEFINCEK